MSSIDHRYASVHMCGNSRLIQDGGNLWKIPVSQYPPSPTGITHFSQCSMAMEVIFIICRPLSCTLRPEKVPPGTREERKLEERQFLGGSQTNFLENGYVADDGEREAGDRVTTVI